jgi:hypothetical protein
MDEEVLAMALPLKSPRELAPEETGLMQDRRRPQLDWVGFR